jgi:DNA-binding transcriptional regulator YdaS (Cro superfamily)
MTQKTFGIELLFSRVKKAELARLLGVTPQAVGQWKDVPMDHVCQISQATGIPLNELRPDQAWPDSAPNNPA